MSYDSSFDLKYHIIEQELLQKVASGDNVNADGTPAFTAEGVEAICHELYKKELKRAFCDDMEGGIDALRTQLESTPVAARIAHDGSTYEKNMALLFVAALCSQGVFHVTHRAIRAGANAPDQASLCAEAVAAAEELVGVKRNSDGKMEDAV